VGKALQLFKSPKFIGNFFVRELLEKLTASLDRLDIPDKARLREDAVAARNNNYPIAMQVNSSHDGRYTSSARADEG